jgi:hypothetical protein
MILTTEVVTAIAAVTFSVVGSSETAVRRDPRDRLRLSTR